jgi:hypothetical protein
VTIEQELNARLEEYKSLRDETLRRIDARNQIISFTLAFAAAMFTLALSEKGFASALLVYPIISFFFSTAFAYNSMMLIQIGKYVRELEEKIPGLNWAAYLGPKYWPIEIFELTASAGLFVGTQVIGLLLYYGLDPRLQTGSGLINWLSLLFVLLTLFSVVYPWFYHRLIQRSAAGSA